MKHPDHWPDLPKERSGQWCASPTGTLSDRKRESQHPRDAQVQLGVEGIVSASDSEKTFVSAADAVLAGKKSISPPVKSRLELAHVAWKDGYVSSEITIEYRAV